MNRLHILPWILLVGITLTLSVFFATYIPHNSGGDIVEYFGMTESLKNHGTVQLTPQDKENLRNYLHPGYFVDTEETENNGGLLYYIQGRDKNFYPVHFFFYSLLVTPVRIVLEAFGQPATNALRFTNLLLLISSIAGIFHFFLKSTKQRLLLILLIFCSPFLFFIIWPGPDMYYLSFLLVAVFAWMYKKEKAAIILTILASWHSQPLIVLAGLLTVWHEVKRIQQTKKLQGDILFLAICAGLILLPYAYNYVLFGVLTPWTILKDGWTEKYGFGPQNISLQKFIEQFFDLNIGLLFYAPFLMGMGIYSYINTGRKYFSTTTLLGIFLVTALFYQTNPAWHYGTAGYGPTRHILFFIPFLVMITISYWNKKTIITWVFVGIIFLLQLGVIVINHDTAPHFEDTLVQSPMAKAILNTFPSLYNPSPEIFVDRTNHNDLKFLKTAVYEINGTCKKAYVVDGDIDPLISICGFIPNSSIPKVYSTNNSFYVNYE